MSRVPSFFFFEVNKATRIIIIGIAKIDKMKIQTVMENFKAKNLRIHFIIFVTNKIMYSNNLKSKISLKNKSAIIYVPTPITQRFFRNEFFFLVPIFLKNKN